MGNVHCDVTLLEGKTSRSMLLWVAAFTWLTCLCWSTGWGTLGCCDRKLSHAISGGIYIISSKPSIFQGHYLTTGHSGATGAFFSAVNEHLPEDGLPFRTTQRTLWLGRRVALPFWFHPESSPPREMVWCQLSTRKVMRWLANAEFHSCEARCAVLRNLLQSISLVYSTYLHT